MVDRKVLFKKIHENKHSIVLIILVFFNSLFIGNLYNNFFFADEVKFLNDANKIKEGRFMQMFYLHRPLHMMLVGLFQDLRVGLFSLRFYGIIFSSLTVIFLYKIFRLKFDENKSFLGALLFLTAPLFSAMTPTILTNNVALFFSVLGLYFYLRFALLNSSKFLLFSSISLSFGLLVRETIIFTFLAILFHLLLSKEFEKVFRFFAPFSLIPLSYSLIFLLLAEPNPWINFFLYNVRTYRYEWLTTFDLPKFAVIYGGILGIWGTICFFRKIYSRNLKDNYDILFSLYFLVCIIFLFIWPVLINRFFVEFFPSLSYFIVASFPKKIPKRILYTIASITLFNYVMTGFFLHLFLEPHRIEIYAVDWVMENIPHQKSIFSSNILINYLLEYNSYNVSHTRENADYIISDFQDTSGEIKSLNFKELKSFRAPCTLIGLRVMRCESYNIRIYERT